MNEAIYTPVLDLMADCQVRSIGQIEQELAGKDITFAQILDVIVILTGTGNLAPAADDAVISKSKRQTAKLNAHLCDQARSSNDIGFLASPVLAGAVTCGRFEQLFLAAIADGKKQPADWAQHVWNILRVQGQNLVKNGEPLTTAEDNIAELTRRATEFSQKKLKVLKSLQVA